MKHGMGAMTKAELRRAEMNIYARKLRGIWWKREDKDNPFDADLLAVGVRRVVKRTSARVLLYTLPEAKSGTRRPALIAKDFRKPLISKIGWPIYLRGELTPWTLPGRFEYDRLMEKVVCREKHQEKSAEGSRRHAKKVKALLKKQEEREGGCSKS